MAVPKRKKSLSRQRKRQRASTREQSPVQACPSCGEQRLPHRVCPACGTYRGRQVLTIAAKD